MLTFWCERTVIVVYTLQKMLCMKGLSELLSKQQLGILSSSSSCTEESKYSKHFTHLLEEMGKSVVICVEAIGM